jgi:hypothetical protein
LIFSAAVFPPVFKPFSPVDSSVIAHLSLEWCLLTAYVNSLVSVGSREYLEISIWFLVKASGFQTIHCLTSALFVACPFHKLRSTYSLQLCNGHRLLSDVFTSRMLCSGFTNTVFCGHSCGCHSHHKCQPPLPLCGPGNFFVLIQTTLYLIPWDFYEPLKWEWGRI